MPFNVWLQWPLKLRVLACEPAIEIDLRRNRYFKLDKRFVGLPFVDREI